LLRPHYKTLFLWESMTNYLTGAMGKSGHVYWSFKYDTLTEKK
jgi:hypothetical protein